MALQRVSEKKNGIPSAPWKKTKRNSKTCLLNLGPPIRVAVNESDLDCSAATFPVSQSTPRSLNRDRLKADSISSKSTRTVVQTTWLPLTTTTHTTAGESHTGTGMSHNDPKNGMKPHNTFKENIPRNCSFPNIHTHQPLEPSLYHHSHIPCSQLPPHPPKPHPTTRASTPHLPDRPSSLHVTTPQVSASVSIPSKNCPSLNTGTCQHISSQDPPAVPHPSSSQDPPTVPLPPTYFPPPRQEDIVFMGSGDDKRRFRKIGVLGRGGSSKVYKVMNEDCEVFALKEVYLKHVDDAVKKAYVTEINFLKRLKNVPEVITLHFFNWDKEQGILSLLLEYGETDLAAIIKNIKPSVASNMPAALYFWNEMLRIIKIIHKEGIIHNDLKPENFVCIKGRLKLIDFGIANRIEDEHTSVQRDMCCGTVKYMSPETIETYEDKSFYKIGRASDVWSLGCILYQMIYGCTPFGHYNKKLQCLQAIVNPGVTISYPDIGNPAAINIMMKCLNRNPKERPTVDQLLSHPFTLNRHT